MVDKTVMDLAVLFVFPALMAYAAASDLTTMTIPNWTSAALVVAFVALSGVAGLGWREVVVGHLACGAAVLAIGFALFAFGWIGGGDAKMAAATTVWIGWDSLSDYGVGASLLGGVLTAAILALRHSPLPVPLARWTWLARLRDPRAGVPYGIALAAAGLVVYPQTAIWMSAA